MFYVCAIRVKLCHPMFIYGAPLLYIFIPSHIFFKYIFDCHVFFWYFTIRNILHCHVHKHTLCFRKKIVFMGMNSYVFHSHVCTTYIRNVLFTYIQKVMSYQRFASMPLDGMEQSHIVFYVVEEFFFCSTKHKTVHILRVNSVHV